jgi:hypothetical protein
MPMITKEGKGQPMLLGFIRATRVAKSLLKAVLWELDELARLSSNENGIDAAAVDSEILAAARTFIQATLREVPYRPAVVPTATGKLQFVWYRGLDTLQLEFESPETISVSQWSGDAGLEEEATFPSAHVDLAVAMIQEFRDGTSPGGDGYFGNSALSCSASAGNRLRYSASVGDSRLLSR